MTFILVAFIIGIFLIGLLQSNTTVISVKKHCNLHKWSYNQDDKMQCTECNYIAGQDFEPRDK